MVTFIIRKFIQTLFIIAGVVTVAFFLVRAIPGDPARVMLGQRADEQTVQALREQYGFDKHIMVQFGLYVERLLHGDLGRSIATRRPVTEVISDSLYETSVLASTSMLIGILFGITLGVLASVRANTWIDTIIMGIAQFGISLPSIVMAALFMMVFGVVLNWLPIAGFIDRGWQYLILPAVSLGIRPLAIIARVTRSSMLDVIGQDYIRTARAKGLNSQTVILRHALRNALNPVVTTVGSWFAGLLAGAYFIEAMFNIPGLGKQSFDALNSLDYPLIQGSVLFSAVVFVAINFLSDLLYAYLDPRIKIQ
ncbi:MAG: ABC transporter permease [Candidatus Kapabacteria bacterium]|nr:ABC transporter permease [Candidatus Kapabacteria bacterium]